MINPIWISVSAPKSSAPPLRAQLRVRLPTCACRTQDHHILLSWTLCFTLQVWSPSPAGSHRVETDCYISVSKVWDRVSKEFLAQHSSTSCPQAGLNFKNSQSLAVPFMVFPETCRHPLCTPHTSLRVPAHWMGAAAQSGTNPVPQIVKKNRFSKGEWYRIKPLDPACSLQGANT